MLHQRLINFHYHVRYKGLDPRDMLHAALTSLLILLNKTLCKCSMLASCWGKILKSRIDEYLKPAPGYPEMTTRHESIREMTACTPAAIKI